MHSAAIVLGIVSSVALTAMAAIGLQNNSAAVLTGNTEAEIVSAAVRAGATFPLDLRAPSLPATYFGEPATPGEAGRKCVAASGVGPIRSGQFVIGGGLSRPRTKDGELKIWWAPMHHAASMSLVVRGRMVGTSGATTEFLSSDVAWPVAGPGQTVPVAERQYFFPSGVSFSSPGTWILVATQGSDWGCFVLNVL
jgi:hypothetical protein